MTDTVSTTRRASAGDEAALVGLRAEMFRSMGASGTVGAWQAAAHEWFAAHLQDPRCGIFVVVEGDRIVACAMGIARDCPPSPNNAGGGDVLITNVCTVPDRRGLGHGPAALDAVLHWARGLGVHRAELMATENGRRIYERVGFATTGFPAMRAVLD